MAERFNVTYRISDVHNEKINQFYNQIEWKGSIDLEVVDSFLELTALAMRDGQYESFESFCIENKISFYAYSDEGYSTVYDAEKGERIYYKAKDALEFVYVSDLVTLAKEGKELSKEELLQKLEGLIAVNSPLDRLRELQLV